MSTGKTKQGRLRRLQIRLTVDEHMEDLFPWLEAMPAAIRGRELIAETRLARRSRSVVTGLAGVVRPAGGHVTGALATPAAGPASSGANSGLTPAALADEAAERAQSRVDVSFFTAVPQFQ